MYALNRKSFSNGWEYTPEWTEDFAAGEGKAEAVRLPHNVGDQPLHYADPSQYSGMVGYRKQLFVPADAQGKHVFLQFDGAAHIATVYVSGVPVTTHYGGYTAFRVELTEYVTYGENNLVAVKLDTSENPALPPFGFVIDYLTFGGLYREAWSEVRGSAYIEDIFVTTPKFRRVSAQFKVRGSFDGIRFTVMGENDEVLAESARYYGSSAKGAVPHADGQSREELSGEAACTNRTDSGANPQGSGKAAKEAFIEDTLEFTVPEARLWELSSPTVYTLLAEIIRGEDVIDTVAETFGFRVMGWKADGFYLNGHRVFLRGLNRHQSYPYMGYAAPASLQAEDARILKEELACNAVRTSHYPQSQSFIDACDRLGLLVFTELPGWQHIGDAAWKDKAVEMVREMVLQYRNHPSIFLWGVRINESQDDDALYKRTNALAHSLDPTRATSGVRYIEKSHLLEDVYAFNDFSHDGTTPGARPKAKVTPDRSKPLFISECCGHMFPTKSYDAMKKRQEQALRHARVMDAAISDGDHAGMFAWCMFDYQTHRDFGAGDRICYHGVMDMFRNPKLAAAVYASQGTKDVLEIGSMMDQGDYDAAQIGDIYAFTNADEVRLYKNDAFVASFTPPAHVEGSGADQAQLQIETAFDALAGKKKHVAKMHRPIKIDDTIGELLKTQEGFDEEKAGILRECLLSAQKHGLSNLPAQDKAKLLYCMTRYGLTFEDGVSLYGKYIGNWGGESVRWRFDAVRDGKVVASVLRCPSHKLHLDVRVSSNVLVDGDTYDAAAVRVRILDENGALTSYAQLPVKFELTGDAALVGPDTATAEGGMCGTYVKTIEADGNGKESSSAYLTISAPGIAPVTISFKVIQKR